MSAAVPAPRHALVLTAGLGTRLRPLTDVRAKPAVPVAGDPLIRRIIAWLSVCGVTELVLNLHHRPETVTAVVGDGSDLGARVRYSWELPSVLGSAGGPRLALPLVGADPFLIVNGDTITDLDVRALAAAHQEAGASVTLALVPNVEPERYGGVRLDADGAVTGFVRRGPEAAGSFHFIGVQMASPDVFRALPAGQAARSIGGVYDELIARRPGSIRGFASKAAFWDIGTPSDYVRTCWAFAGANDTIVGHRVEIDRSAHLGRCILWDDVQVGADCRLNDCIATDRVHVPAGSHYERMILTASESATPTACPL